MNDRDDYPDDPYRGRAGRGRGYDYDPLGDPLPAPPSRGRRARPDSWEDAPSAGGRGDGYDPLGPGGPQNTGSPRPPRRGGAADALRGSRAARSGGGHLYETGSHQRPVPPSQPAGGDATQDALAALEGLGEPASAAPAPARPEEETPRRGRRARAEQEPEAPPAPEQDEPRSRRGRRASAQDDTGGRRRSRRGRRDEPVGGFLDDAPEADDVFDTGSFPGVHTSADTGAFAAVPPPSKGRSRRGRSEPEEELPETPSRRGGRRRRGAAEELPEDSGEFRQDAEPRGRRARRGRDDHEAPAPAEALPDEETEDVPEEPRSRRRGGGRRRRGAAEAPVEKAADDETRGGRRRGRREEPEEPEEEYDYEEPGLAEIAEAYGGGRKRRKKAKELKKAREAHRRAASGRGPRGKGMMILLCLALVIVVGGGGYTVLRTYVFPADFSGEGTDEVVFVIEEQQSGLTVGENLTDLGVVASPRAFTNALESLSPDELGNGLTPGTYSLALGMSADSAVRALLDPANRIEGRITFKEGLRNEQILEILAESTGASLEDLQAAHARTEELNLPDYATQGPAGYLFPATYRFESDTEPLSMLLAMTAKFHEVAEEIQLEERAAAAGYDPNEIMAIASIIQAESGGEEDMPKISAVIHNRLEQDMMLQMDSTCFYAIGEYGIALNNEQRLKCEADTSGFDTYHKKGLIPGPFVAPGQAAIEAALEPADADYLYFVATDPEAGVTEFTGDYQEFLLLKEKFEETWMGGGE
ncbi:endolytic transglycosylase MltG [Nocardiopsis algeriensis]|uniref:Endolytic murein transglycosylase n=1 Tax=Nocardiopsis algeriensis TaxID=1478215 RepID=A0A841IMR7_9ACTN|nr:endolytic transglycosylase MltG [Nocardiopsis algeriensis]MBB6119362.1 UPF0755 protein [Nocardiopsis algeriensis]